jgi:gamma-glutamylcyclotransferase (GGCT)/AIG2-like uncharacterized protein YtfP
MEYLFVYGLFRDSAKNLLGDHTYCGRAYVEGTIYKVNEFYPGYVANGKNKTWGDVYLIDPIVFEDLDVFEGDEYIRKKTRTSTDVECWIYEFKDDVTNFKEIKGGDWMLR